MTKGYVSMTKGDYPCGMELASEYPLTEEHVRRYRENGHVHLKGVCTREQIAEYRGVLKELTAVRFAGGE